MKCSTPNLTFLRLLIAGIFLGGCHSESAGTNDGTGDESSPASTGGTDFETDSSTDHPEDRDTETTVTTDPDADNDTLDTAPGPDAGDDGSMYGLAVTENPNNVLSCYVTWTTDAPASSTVTFRSGDSEIVVNDDAQVEYHRLFVMGLYADTEYAVEAVSTGDDPFGTGRLDTRYTTGSLPDFVPPLTVGVADGTRAQPGWTLFNISDITANPPPQAVILMVDEAGVPVWYYRHGELPDDRGDIDARLLDNGHIAVGATSHEPAVEVNLEGEVVWRGPEQGFEEQMHHHFDKLSDGNYVTLRHTRLDTVIDGEDLIFFGDAVEVFAPDLEVVMHWNVFDHMLPGADDNQEWTHANSVTFDETNGVFYLNSRNLNALFKVSLSGNQDVLWRFGEGGDVAADPDRDHPWCIHQHDPELQSDGTWLVYDNGAAERPFSRVVRYAIDETTMTSELVWEFPADATGALDAWYTDHWYTRFWGDADGLSNDNVLIAAGTWDDGLESRIFEVTPAGEVVFELQLPMHDEHALGVYRAERIPRFAGDPRYASDIPVPKLGPKTEVVDTPKATSGSRCSVAAPGSASRMWGSLFNLLR